jgi:hypothetical protein
VTSTSREVDDEDSRTIGGIMARSAIRTIILAGILALGGIPGSSAQLFAAPEGQSGPGRVDLLKTPDEGIQPQAAIDAKGTIYLVYFKGEPSGGDLFYTRLEPGQHAFAPPVRINSQPGSAIAIGTIRGAHLALGRDGRVHVAWNGSGNARPLNAFGSNPMLYARSDKDGATFEPQRNLMQRTSALDGGGTIAADRAGNVYVAWHGRTEEAGPGEAARRMWVARSMDDGATFAPEEPALDKETGACGCCGTRALADRRGGLYILYRAATAGTGRDMYLLTSHDQGAHFEGWSVHPWKIEACPMSSASLAESGSGILAAWETNQEIYFARIEPESSKVSSPVKPPGHAGRKHPAVASNPRGETILVWAEGTSWQKGGALVWQVFDHAGQPTSVRGRVEKGIPTWGLPAVVGRPDGSFLIIH